MVSIYPNPANEKVNIFINSPKEETIKINVINALGQVIYSFEKEVLGEQTIQINTKNFAEGIYHINIQSSNSRFNKTISVTH
jgi:ABC-type sugar transport system ATPase subunit